MEITITKEEFEGVILAATNSESDVFESVEPYINEAKHQLFTLLMQQGIEALDTNAELLRLSKKFLCEQGFLIAIPHLDIVLTGSGFGVVSNDHVAPASGERVKALTDAVGKAYDYTHTDIIKQLCKVTGWGSNQSVRIIVPHLMWNKRETEKRIGKEMLHSDWMKTSAELYDIQFKLAEQIGHEIFNVILTAECSDECTGRLEMARDLLVMSMANIYRNRKDGRMVTSYMNHMINWFDEVANEYPEYTNSREYQARHIQMHENKKGCPAFFFGV